MTRPTFEDLKPPSGLMDQWVYGNQGPIQCMTAAARWGAQHAAEQLAGQWPEPITDRRPTRADADLNGFIQCFDHWGHWVAMGIETALVMQPEAWQHTARWQPPAPPTLKEQALGVLAGLEKRCDLQCNLSLIRRALEQAS